MLVQDFVHQPYPDSSAIVELGCSWKMAPWPPLKDYLLGIPRKSKGHLATLQQLDSIGMLLSMQNFRSASEDTDSTATSQASMRTWVPFDFMACEVWAKTSVFMTSPSADFTLPYLKKGRPTSCSCLDHMGIFDELNLTSSLSCYTYFKAMEGMQNYSRNQLPTHAADSPARAVGHLPLQGFFLDGKLKPSVSCPVPPGFHRRNEFCGKPR